MSDDETPTVNPLDADLERRLLQRRTLLLGAALEEANGNRLCNALLLLAAEDAHADIRLLINSPGGSVSAMLAIRDCMRVIPNDVSTVALGAAYSAGQFLLSSGTKGKRYALPHAQVLLHQGSAGFGGTAMDIAIQAGQLRHTRDTVLSLVAQDTGQDIATVERDSQRDRFFTAQEALDYGFIDAIVDSMDQVGPIASRTAGLGATR
ncbi:ClpP family protease [Allobranchiibius huperziae]|uniref:ATP-dependent Clp protease proteolytic subunit n=1 Tax=Allobranchiibius huperziae TaxID=1874116 RepID=A0A853DLF7_9MICO|nr:ATP-dependent Clp protease proteolytic subunit [Allobranchiibius huperziae]NYJ74975.1 ATP-dependent Clp protease protease subunit [Allobranchiibius huperziae]